MLKLWTIAGFLALVGVACSEQRQSDTMGGNRGEPNIAEPAPTTQSQIAEGNVSRIDKKNDFIWVKTTDGKEMRFSYTLMTDVQGAANGVEGLVDNVEALAPGTQVRIHYKPGIDTDVLSDDEVNQVSKIEVDRAL
jgi:hypothetical protein